MYSIAAIVAAYNEEKTVGSVIEVLKNIDIIEKIIVVSDGSTDRTANIVSKYDYINFISIEKNIGKGASVIEGLKECEGYDVVLLLDADLIGLREEHVYDLLNPVIVDDADMAIGLFAGGRVSTDIAQKITPYLSGQRAMKKSLLDKIPEMDTNQYGLESAITNYVKKNSVNYKMVKLKGLTHMTKEEKMGIWKGLKHRVRMYMDVFKVMKKK